MGTIKNAVYKVDNGTDFDEIHFKTKAAQVFCNDGKTVESQLAEKMNKTIQTFEPTFVNGWVNYDWAGGNDALKYYKNDSGVLKIEGIITGGTSVYVCNLPFGFRPSRSKMIAGIAELNGNTVSISIKIWNDGNIAILNWVSGMTKAIINGSIKL